MILVDESHFIFPVLFFLESTPFRPIFVMRYLSYVSFAHYICLVLTT